MKLDLKLLCFFFMSCRSFATPPPPVQVVCECVAIFRGFKGDADWKVAKGMMADTNFLASLQNLEVDSITMAQVRACGIHQVKVDDVM